MKLAPDGNASTPAGPSSARPAATRPRSSTSALTRRSMSATWRTARRPGELLGRVEVVRQDDLVELGDHPRRRRPRTRGRAAAMLHVFENVRTTTRRPSSATRSSADHEENSAYASSTTTRPLVAASDDVDHFGRLDDAGRVVRRAQERHRRIGARDHPGDVVRIEREVVAALTGDDGRPGDPGDVARAAGRSARTRPRCDRARRTRAAATG